MTHGHLSLRHRNRLRHRRRPPDIVTLDALGCQTDFAEKIVAQDGDYVLALKTNQKNLSQALVEFFETAEALDFRHIDVQKRDLMEKDHGRLETRRAVFVADVSWMDKPMRDGWKKLGCRRHDRGGAGD